MTIKKLTVAAAIAVGIATCSFSNAMAACPISGGGCSNGQMTTAPAVCPKCGKTNCTCGCNSCATPCAPCAVPCAPCASNCDCNSCNSCNSCATPCCKPAVPACATCPSTSCIEHDMKQVYAYPAAIYGDNNYVGEQQNAIYSTDTAFELDSCDALAMSRTGVSVLSCGSPTYGHLMGAAVPIGGCGCGCNTGCACSLPIVMDSSCGCMSNLTGCAAPIGCGCGSCGCQPSGCGCCDGGSIVSRNCCCAEDTTCPITISTCNSIDAIKKSFVPFEPKISGTQCACGCSGAAAPLVNAFPDVPENYWAACPIDKLAMNDVVVGYPDRTFKPGRCVSRAEFATMMVKGYNLNSCGLCSKSLFKDVPRGHWANPLIAKAVEEGIMCGYPDCKFKPNQSVSRVEAITAMAHGITCDMDACKAKEILSQYCDGCSVPDWAQIPVAKALLSGVLKTSLDPNTISPCKEASRAEIADMLQNTRVTIGYDTNPATACACPAPVEPCCPKKAYMENEEMIKIPTLKLKFKDEINAKSSHVGQQFAATTCEEVTLNGKCYPCGSRVNGKIVEVIRPNGCEKGALKLAFTNIEDCCGCQCDLPRQILTAQVSCENQQNIVARLVAAPFTMFGGLVGTTARTLGGMISNAGNAVENVSGGVGIASSEIFQGQFRAAGRSLQDAAKETIVAPIDFTRTAISGATGLFQTTGDEVAYLVDPKGAKISAINPTERVTIAFGCAGQ